MRHPVCSHWFPMVSTMLLRAAFDKGRCISTVKIVSQTALALSEFWMLWVRSTMKLHKALKEHSVQQHFPHKYLE